MTSSDFVLLSVSGIEAQETVPGHHSNREREPSLGQVDDLDGKRQGGPESTSAICFLGLADSTGRGGEKGERSE
jgi:hypothetical protein